VSNLPVVYVAGPVTARTTRQRWLNIARAQQVGFVIWRLGAVAVVPHLNSLGLGDHITDEIIYRGDLELLARCDAMFRLPGWKRSRGTCYETAWAVRLGIPIFEDLDELACWVQRA